MRIVHLASEAVPYVKTGGLADVVGALSRFLSTRGHEVSVILPRYRELEVAASRLEPTGVELDLDVAGATRRATLWHLEGARSESDVFFVDVPEYFDREGLYGHGGTDHADNAERFSFFVRASLAACRELELAPDVIHCHDWQTALAPVYLRTVLAEQRPFRAVRSVLTIHNLAYQGVFDRSALRSAGLPEELFHLEALEFYGQIGFLKGGIVYADRLTTVSPSYAEEIRTPEFGNGLEGLLSSRAGHLVGILNGIDTRLWDPAADPSLPAAYDETDFAGKAVCKRELQRRFRLEEEEGTPLFGFIGRLVEQKGLPLLEEIGRELGALEAQFVFLGTGDPSHEERIRQLADRHPNVAARIAFSEELAHLVEGGADFLLMPSRFEPCGLGQMISQRYGTVPVVRAVGGLRDTVVDCTPSALEQDRATGIAFGPYEAGALREAIGRARELYGRPEALRRVRLAGMRRDFSWSASAHLYEQVYRGAAGAPHSQPGTETTEDARKSEGRAGEAR